MPHWMLYGATAFFTVMLVGRLVAALMPRSSVTRFMENGLRRGAAPGTRRRMQAWQISARD